jgi:hypothetical protein
VALFRRRQNPIQPLSIDLALGHGVAGAQDNVPGPGALDLEATERAAAMREVARTVRSQAIIGLGAPGEQQLDPGSNSAVLMPNNDDVED